MLFLIQPNSDNQKKKHVPGTNFKVGILIKTYEVPGIMLLFRVIRLQLLDMFTRYFSCN